MPMHARLKHCARASQCREAEAAPACAWRGPALWGAGLCSRPPAPLADALHINAGKPLLACRRGIIRAFFAPLCVMEQNERCVKSQIALLQQPGSSRRYEWLAVAGTCRAPWLLQFFRTQALHKRATKAPFGADQPVCAMFGPAGTSAASASSSAWAKPWRSWPGRRGPSTYSHPAILSPNVQGLCKDMQ